MSGVKVYAVALPGSLLSGRWLFVLGHAVPFMVRPCWQTQQLDLTCMSPEECMQAPLGGTISTINTERRPRLFLERLAAAEDAAWPGESLSLLVYS